ncbi:unnamed protein product [Sphagnum compactum]
MFILTSMPWWILILFFFNSAETTILAAATSDNITVLRSSFPKGFIFGTATAAYQYEGAAKECGKGPSIWDVFTHIPGHIIDNSTGDVAVDQYHRMEEDVWLLKDLNMDAYRFSISWARILPSGRGRVNWPGVMYYNRLINYLLLQNIVPFVTLYHWDLPEALEESIGGWLNSEIVEIYGEFAQLCFQLFGDRVKHWITFNEIHSFAGSGYFSGKNAPGRCSAPYGNCTQGNSLTEPYIVAHNALNAHALAVNIYKTQFQDEQKGLIGITADSPWYEPLTDSSQDKEAAQFGIEDFIGWFLDPIFFGDYPASMRASLGNRLPHFTAKQSAAIKGSYDFIGLNHYSSQYATRNDSDGSIAITPYKNGVLIGPTTPSDWLFVVPSGMRKILGWIRERYNNPIIYITENGVDEVNSEDLLPLNEQLHDLQRIQYHHDYMQNILLAMRDGSDVRGYFAWSLLDNFEWDSGFSVRFGIYYVDYKNKRARYPKSSAYWFQHILKRRGFVGS